MGLEDGINQNSEKNGFNARQAKLSEQGINQNSEENWLANAPDDGSQDSNVDDHADGLQSRTEAARKIAGAGRSGWRPFWDYEQESLDAAAISWTVETNLDGSLAALYVQAPYGYQNDVFGADKSVILGKIAESMRSSGHENWADSVDADRVSAVDWRSGNCQTFGLSYVDDRRPDPVKLTALSAFDPYGIKPFGGEWLTAQTPDEKILEKILKASTGRFWPWIVAGAVLFASTNFLGAVATAIGLDLVASLISRGRRQKKMIEAKATMERPGYILETTGGWLVWQYDWPTEGMDAAGKQKLLAGEASRRVRDLIRKQHAGDPVKPQVVDTAVSSDGRLAWFRSSVPLTGAQCELSPYQAEQYLSLYVKHQKQAGGLPGRDYGDSKPTVIMSTVGEAAVPSGRPNAVNMGEWSADGAVRRAMDAMDNTGDGVAYSVTSEAGVSGQQADEAGASTEDTASGAARLDSMATEVETLARALMSKAVVSQASQSVDATRIAASALKAARESRKLAVVSDAADPEAVDRLAGSLSKWKESLVAASRLLDAAVLPASPLEAVGLPAEAGLLSGSDQNAWGSVAASELAAGAAAITAPWTFGHDSASGATPLPESTPRERGILESAALHQNSEQAGTESAAAFTARVNPTGNGSATPPMNPFKRAK